MKHKYLNNSGLSIVATVLVLLALALLSLSGVSLVTTGTGVGIQEERGLEAFYIADGGLQYTARQISSLILPSLPSVNLGNGSFTVSVPTLTANITAATTGPIAVTSTDGFIFNIGDPTNYWIMLCDTQAPDNNPTPPLLATTTTCEKISCTGKTATNLYRLHKGKRL